MHKRDPAAPREDTMKCANPNCQNHLHYLRGGSLRLLELESAPHTRLRGEAGGFPVYRSLARYFWLCAECSSFLILRRWTPAGLILESQHAGKKPASWTVPPAPAVDADSILHFHRRVARSA